MSEDAKSKKGGEKIPAPNSSLSKHYGTFRKGGMKAVRAEAEKDAKGGK